MVAPGGKQLDSAGLTAFFRAAGGSRPGLQMRISDLVLIQESAAGATVSYREFQSLPSARKYRAFVDENAYMKKHQLAPCCGAICTRRGWLD